MVGDQQRTQRRSRLRRLPEHAQSGRPFDRHRFAAAARSFAEAERLRAGLDRGRRGAQRLFGEDLAAAADHPQVDGSPLGRRRDRGREDENESQRARCDQPEWNESWHLSHPFREGCHGWPGTGLLAPGNRSAAPSRRLCVAPSGWRNAPAASFTPVTVAGPRRLLTGLPLTTDRIYAGESIRRGRFQWRDPYSLMAARPASASEPTELELSSNMLPSASVVRRPYGLPQ